MAEQKLKKLPLGLSDFKKIIDGDYVYVDKTQLIYELIAGGDYYFLSRPRRFGKSLLISTLEELFSGNKKLFENLWIGKSGYTWPVYPIIHFDFSSISNLSVQELRQDIIDTIEEIAITYAIEVPKQQTIAGKFKALIKQLATINQVVILVDEYDKPILDHIDNLDEAKAQRAVLKSLYTAIKGSDRYIKFLLLTGVSKFAKTSIFSGINNLRDITLSKQYATLLGYTHQELTDNFADYLEKQVPEIGDTVPAVIKNMQQQYDGYQFFQNSELVFNPYSVLTSFTENALGNYWFATGTPTFLITLMKTSTYPLNRIYQPIMSADELDGFEPNDIKITALLYQTGYLTIKDYNKNSKGYTLDFPNYEVASAFNLLVSTSFTQLTGDQTKTYAAQIAQAFAQKNMVELQNILQSFFNEMPYNVHIKREFDLQIIIFSVFKLIGIEVDSEVVTSLAVPAEAFSEGWGRADLVVSLPKLVYVIELKFNKTAQEALSQIQDKKYYEKYLNSGKKITLLGINFDEPTKTVSLESCGV